MKLQILLGALLVLPAAHADSSHGKPQSTSNTKNGKVYVTDRYGSGKTPAYVVENNRVYATDKYGTRVGQAYRIEGNRV